MVYDNNAQHRTQSVYTSREVHDQSATCTMHFTKFTLLSHTHTSNRYTLKKKRYRH